MIPFERGAVDRNIFGKMPFLPSPDNILIKVTFFKYQNNMISQTDHHR